MSDKPYFPLYMDLSGRDILFIGGGSIAGRRIRVLLPFVDKIRVIAPEVGDDVREMIDGGQAVVWEQKEFSREDLAGAEIVFAATDDKELNADIAAQCDMLGILSNVASDKSLCDFYFPGIVRQGETVIGVNASGQDHRKARRVRERIEEILSEEGI